jgi:hypothetical protein
MNTNNAFCFTFVSIRVHSWLKSKIRYAVRVPYLRRLSGSALSQVADVITLQTL